MLSCEAQKCGAGAFIEGVAKIQLASDPVRVSLKGEPHGERGDLGPVRDADA